jgi:hypothetical protein
VDILLSGTKLTCNELHVDEPYLRDSRLCSYSITFLHNMEAKVSQPCSQEPSTCPCPKPDQSNPYHPILSKIHFNIIHTPTSFFPLPIWLLHQHAVLYVYTWRRVNITKLFIMLFSSTSCHFIFFRSKYSPQHPCLKHPQPMFLP